jgi:hypothetical protein
MGAATNPRHRAAAILENFEAPMAAAGDGVGGALGGGGVGGGGAAFIPGLGLSEEAARRMDASMSGTSCVVQRDTTLVLFVVVSMLLLFRDSAFQRRRATYGRVYVKT